MLFSSITNVKGCSGNVFKVSNNNLAGIATLPLLSLSTSKVDEWYNDYYYDEANDMYIPYNCDTFEKNSKQGVSKKLGIKPGDWIKTKMP